MAYIIAHGHGTGKAFRFRSATYSRSVCLGRDISISPSPSRQAADWRRALQQIRRAANECMAVAGVTV